MSPILSEIQVSVESNTVLKVCLLFVSYLLLIVCWKGLLLLKYLIKECLDDICVYYMFCITCAYFLLTDSRCLLGLLYIIMVYILDSMKVDCVLFCFKGLLASHTNVSYDNYV